MVLGLALAIYAGALFSEVRGMSRRIEENAGRPNSNVQITTSSGTLITMDQLRLILWFQTGVTALLGVGGIYLIIPQR